MDYFEGVTLDDFVKQHGPLPAQEARVLARQMAEGLSAAHAKEILHRDVKPGNVLVERAPSGLRIKLIDFGLAMRQRAVHNTISNANALSNTIRGQSIAGTVDYASPEQMGKLPGEAISPKSDVYGYGRTLCFALFGTPKPGPRHWKELKDEQFGELIGECIEESPSNRPGSFKVLLERLVSPSEVVVPIATTTPQQPADRPQGHSATETSQHNQPALSINEEWEQFQNSFEDLPHELFDATFRSSKDLLVRALGEEDYDGLIDFAKVIQNTQNDIYRLSIEGHDTAGMEKVLENGIAKMRLIISRRRCRG